MASNATTKRDKHIGYLFDAELQFRLTGAVRIAVTHDRQPLDFPQLWTHGKYSVSYDEMALRHDQAEYAAHVIQHSATLTMAVAVKDAIEAVVPGIPGAVRRVGNQIQRAVDDAISKTKPKPCIVADCQVAAAYHISRLIRNAYAHAPFAPKWMINSGIRDEIFSIPDVIELRTRDLHDSDFDWRHYGGLLGLYQLCRFTRFKILGDEYKPRQNIPTPQRTLYQQGNLFLEVIDEIPEGYVRSEIELHPGKSIDLGHGHILRPVEPQRDADDQTHSPESEIGPVF